MEGRDYILPDNTKLFIPRGSVTTTFYVKLLNSADLADKKLNIVLKLEPNEFFDTLLVSRLANVLGDRMISTRTFKITFSNMVSIPNFWAEYENLFGTFSQSKYLLMLEVNSLDVNFDLSSFTEDDYWILAKQTQLYLDMEAANGNVIREEDGSIMVMGPDVQ